MQTIKAHRFKKVYIVAIFRLGFLPALAGCLSTLIQCLPTLTQTFQPVRYPRLPFGILIHIANSSTIVVLATIRNLHFPILLGAKIL